MRQKRKDHGGCANASGRASAGAYPGSAWPSKAIELSALSDIRRLALLPPNDARDAKLVEELLSGKVAFGPI
jgi:hypothetical protein